MDLSGRVALVTGAGRGIGKGIALRLAASGGDIVIHEKDHREESNVRCVLEEIEKLGRKAIDVYGDVTQPTQVEAFIASANKRMGRIDILVNSAGINFKQGVETMSEEQWDMVMNVNAKSVFLTSRAVIPYMKALGKGKIINVSSTSGKNGHPYFAHYCASKFAVIGFSNSLAKELAPYEITVNVICPGYVWTPMWEKLAQEVALPGETPLDSWNRIVRTNIPLGRAQTAKDMGDLAVYFATADNVTGQAVNVDGGEEWH